MFEYSSVSASSYDPSALVAKLNESTADGWDVVAIVPTGGDVSAFLRREVETAAAGDGDSGATDTVTDATPVGGEVAAWSAGAAGTEAAAASAETEPAAGETAAVESPSAVDEPAGWAAEPEPADVPLGAGEEEVAAGAGHAAAVDEAAAEAPAAATGLLGPGGTVGNDASSVSEEPAVAAAEAPAAPAPEPAVVTTPAGWYPDPSGRYELRYWDSSQWTEHVARQGQQFTDPPVR
jgi:hypothetical protein